MGRVPVDGAAGQDEQKQVVVKIKMNENENKLE